MTKTENITVLSIPVMINGKEERRTERIYNIHNFPYRTCLNDENIVKKGKGKDAVEYYNTACAFDIETTTIETEKDVLGNYINERPFAFMYHWQVCIDDKVCFGRRWEELIYFIKELSELHELSEKKRLVWYVHNLAYEFQFISAFFNFIDIFAKDKRKPMKATISEGIEFRCSYFLSNMSLAKFCENSADVIHYKLTDTYDYRKLRTFRTELNETEQGYCYNDVRGLCECINDRLKDHDIAHIPLTSTGYVRESFRKACLSNPKYWRNFQKLQLSEEQYKLCRELFRGGNTHANRYYAGRILKNLRSFDIQSSYPTVMMCDYVPVSAFREIKFRSQKQLDSYLSKYCVIMRLELFDVSIKDDVAVPYLDYAHAKKEIMGEICDNGRILYADHCIYSCTEIDLQILRKQYNFKFRILESYYAKRGLMPLEFRQELLKYYQLKTDLKGVSGKEYEYAKAKNKVNGAYGMCVMAIDHDEYTFNQLEHIWDDPQKANLEKSLDDFYKNRNSFLSYQHGCYITAHARRRLQMALDEVGMDMVYCDTDSVKFINPEQHLQWFRATNNYIMEQARTNDIPAFAEKDGKKYYLGIWDDDGNYKRFRTWGSKKYAYDQQEKDGSTSFHITVSGMSKKLGAKACGSLENFTIGKTYQNVGRTVSYFHDEGVHSITVNGDTFTTAGSIGIVDTTYTLGITDEYAELIS